MTDPTPLLQMRNVRKTTHLNAGELPSTVQVRAGDVTFDARVRIDTPKEADYFRHGGILQYVLRQLLAA